MLGCWVSDNPISHTLSETSLVRLNTKPPHLRIPLQEHKDFNFNFIGLFWFYIGSALCLLAECTQEVAVSHLPCHWFIACARQRCPSLFYSSNHPKADTAYFFEACNNEEGAGVFFHNFMVTWLLFCYTKYLNWQHYHKYFHLQCTAIKGVAVVQQKYFQLELKFFLWICYLLPGMGKLLNTSLVQFSQA